MKDYIIAGRLESYCDNSVTYFQTTKYKFEGRGSAMLAAAFRDLSNRGGRKTVRFVVKCGRALVVVHCGRVIYPKTVARRRLAGWVMTGHAKEEGSQYDWNLYIASDNVGFQRLSCHMQRRILGDDLYLWIENHTQIALGLRGDFGVELELSCSGVRNVILRASDWLQSGVMLSKSFRMKHLFEQYSFGGLK